MRSISLSMSILSMSRLTSRRVRLRRSRGWSFSPDRMVFLRGPYDLSLLPKFGKHVACRLWVDVEVSIIV
jgi:hypothetical protein